MSCNGCRVLRKGCSDSCILRPCLQWIDTAEAQAHATLFVAKFFGRADLMSFISAVPTFQRPALFQSLLFEACGRTVNPVNGAVGLLSTGNWHICQAAVDTVLHGGTLHPTHPEFLPRGLNAAPPHGTLRPLRPKTYMQEEQGRNTSSFGSELSDNVTGNNCFESSGENDGDALVGQNMKLLNLFV